MTVRSVLRVMVTSGPLRRVTTATVLTAAGGGALPVLAVLLADVLGAGAGAGAALVAVFGLGNLAASLLVTAVPLRGEPERLVSRGAVVVAAVLVLCAIAPTYPLAFAAFALAGVSTAPFFTATLAARSRYSPPGARAQVFISSAGLKVAAASTGTVLAGALAAAGPRSLLAAAAAITFAAVATTALDRRLSTRHHPTTPAR